MVKKVTGAHSHGFQNLQGNKTFRVFRYFLRLYWRSSLFRHFFPKKAALPKISDFGHKKRFFTATFFRSGHLFFFSQTVLARFFQKKCEIKSYFLNFATPVWEHFFDEKKLSGRAIFRYNAIFDKNRWGA